MRLLFVAAALAAALLQTSIMPLLAPLGGIPNLIVALGIVLFILRRRRASFWFFAWGGLFLDLLSPASPGFFTSGLLILYGLLALLTARIEPSLPAALAAAFFATLLVDLAWIVQARALVPALVEAVLTTALCFVLLWGMQRVIGEERIRV